MADKKPPGDQATHGSGKRSAEHASSDAQRFVGTRNETTADNDGKKADNDGKKRDVRRKKA